MGQMISKAPLCMILDEYQDNFCPVHQRHLRGEEKLASDGQLGQGYVRWWSSWGTELCGRLLSTSCWGQTNLLRAKLNKEGWVLRAPCYDTQRFRSLVPSVLLPLAPLPALVSSQARPTSVWVSSWALWIWLTLCKDKRATHSGHCGDWCILQDGHAQEIHFYNRDSSAWQYLWKLNMEYGIWVMKKMEGVTLMYVITSLRDEKNL